MKENRLGQNFGAVQLLRFALPTVLMMLFTSLYTMVDGIFVARLVNEYALSAINIINPLISFVMGVGIMLAAGGSAYVARNMGEGKALEAKQNFTLITLVALGCGIVLTVVLFVFADPLVRLLGSTDVLLPYCLAYLNCIAPFMASWIIQLIFESFFVAAGNPKLGLLVTIGAGVFNMVGDYVAIAWLGLGIQGAALATGAATLIPCVVGFVYFLNKGRSVCFARPAWRGRVVSQSCFNGISEMISNLSAMVVTLSYNLIMIKLAGEQGVAAISVILYMEFLFTAGFYGFASGVAPIISYNFGAGYRTRMKRIVKDCYKFVCVGSVCVFCVSYFGSEALVSVFADPGTPLFQTAAEGMRVFSFGFLFAGVSLMTSNMFTALSNGFVSAVISTLRSFVFVIICLYGFSYCFGVQGVWAAVPVAEVMSLAVCIICLAVVGKRYFSSSESEGHSTSSGDR